MFDIGFYMRVGELKRRLTAGRVLDRDRVFDLVEGCRSRTPVIYNIETTNACNMRCEMCPRTTLMTRKVAHLGLEVYKRIVGQLEPHAPGLWGRWERFVERYYGIAKGGMGENHFFLHIIPRVLVLHGYGDPLLDRDMPERVRLLARKGIPSYFSCNPANIDVERSLSIFESGLGYIKYSIESVDDKRHKKIRGAASDFTGSYRKIVRLLDERERRRFKTVFVITMLDLGKPDQEREFERLREAFKGMDVYIYLKSQDQQWYQGQGRGTNSIHWTEWCQFPWSSMTVKSDGQAVECVEDYDNEIVLGDAARESLLDIWNGERYRRLRLDHFRLTPGLKCTERCDMTLVGRLLRGPAAGERRERGTAHGNEKA